MQISAPKFGFSSGVEPVLACPDAASPLYRTMAKDTERQGTPGHYDVHSGESETTRQGKDWHHYAHGGWDQGTDDGSRLASVSLSGPKRRFRHHQKP
jgi:hypothetical protein